MSFAGLAKRFLLFPASRQNWLCRACVMEFAILGSNFFGLFCGGIFKRIRYSESTGID